LFPSLPLIVPEIGTTITTVLIGCVDAMKEENNLLLIYLILIALTLSKPMLISITDSLKKLMLKLNTPLILRILPKNSKVNMGKLTDVDGTEYQVEEILIHTPAEHTIKGQKFDAEL